MLLVSRALPVVNRRRVLIGAAALALLGPPATACAPPPPPPGVDGLTAQLERARADSQLAADAATAAPKDVARALNTVAAERSAHAQALSDQLVRLTGKSAPTTTAAPAADTSGSAATSTQAKPPAPSDVVTALHQSADSAAQLTPTLSGYSAGLVGSIAAACTAAYSVALASTGPAS
jgi:hypothetical protein